MKHDHPQFKLRIPQKLKDDLEREAEKNDRTLTGEIVARLEGSFSVGAAPVPAHDLAHLYDLLMAQTELQRLMTEQQAARDALFWAAQDLEKTDKALAELIRQEGQDEKLAEAVKAHEDAALAYSTAGKASTAAYVAVRDQQKKIAALQPSRQDSDSKRYLTARPDGSIAPFEPPEEHPVAAPPASQGPERMRRQVNRRRPT